jgi:hypothetical protein
MAQPAPFTKQNARDARRTYQHVAAVVNRLLNRAMAITEDEVAAKKYFTPTLFHTVHALHAFFHGRDLTKKDLIKAHKFVTPFFDYRGNDENAGRFMDRRLDSLDAAERAFGRRFIPVQRADNETLLFTWYQGHPLLDAAEWVYHQARQKPDYWKNPATAVTEELLDAALEKLPVIEVELAALTSEAEGEGEEGERERWESPDLMAGQILKGRWTKIQNNVLRLLTDEFDAGGDPELVAAREAAKIIKSGKDIKARLARERLRAVASVRSADEIADSPTGREGDLSTMRILEEVEMEAPHSVCVDSGKDSVPSTQGGTPDINVGGSESEVIDSVELESEALPYALDMAAQGIAVFPVYGCTDGVCHCPEGSECRSAGKHPIPSLTPRGVKNATIDPKQIRRWFAKEPHANLAWAMGGLLRLIGVDVDPRSEGDASLCDLVEAHGAAWLETFTVRTGSLGNHFVFRLPEGVEPHRGKLAPGIDLKAEGGYLVAPPSVHASGRRYEVEKNVYIAEAPDWLVAELTRSEGEPAKVPVDFQAYRDRKSSGGGPIIVEGERNERLFRVGCALWGKGEVGSRAELLQRLMETNVERVSPPLAPDEVYKIVDSISSRYPFGVPIREGAA